MISVHLPCECEMCEHCETAETERARDRERMEREWEREREREGVCVAVGLFSVNRSNRRRSKAIEFASTLLKIHYLHRVFIRYQCWLYKYCCHCCTMPKTENYFCGKPASTELNMYIYFWVFSWKLPSFELRATRIPTICIARMFHNSLAFI